MAAPETVAFFLDPDTGWVANAKPGPEAENVPSEITIWRTIDSGTTWQAATVEGPPIPSPNPPPALWLRGLEFVDTQHGWLTAGNAGGNLGFALLYGTTDGGETWEQLAGLQGFSGSGGTVTMANASEGWWT